MCQEMNPFLHWLIPSLVSSSASSISFLLYPLMHSYFFPFFNPFPSLSFPPLPPFFPHQFPTLLSLSAVCTSMTELLIPFVVFCLFSFFLLLFPWTFSPFPFFLYVLCIPFHHSSPIFLLMSWLPSPIFHYLPALFTTFKLWHMDNFWLYSGIKTLLHKTIKSHFHLKCSVSYENVIMWV